MDDGRNTRSLSGALGTAVGNLYERGSSSDRAAALWAEAVGPVGLRHTRGVYVKDAEREGDLPTLFVYLDGNAFVYEYRTDHILYEQRLAYLGFPVAAVEFRLSSSAGRPAPARPFAAPTALEAAAPKAAPLDELAPLDGERDRWARRAVESLPDELGRAVYDAMTSTMRRDQSEDETR